MKALRWVALVAYIGYLVQVGMLMVWLPWSRLWGHLVLTMPHPASWLLDAPATRGAITAFGVLHLAMVVVELIHAGSFSGGDRANQT